MNGPFSENTDTPLSTSTTISSQQHWAESEGGEVSPLIPVERSNEGEASSLPQRKMVLDSKGTVMWKGCAAAGTTRSEETTSQDQFPISRLSSSRGLDLKRGKPSAVWSHSPPYSQAGFGQFLPSQGAAGSPEVEEPELKRVFLEMQERRRSPPMRISERGD